MKKLVIPFLLVVIGSLIMVVALLATSGGNKATEEPVAAATATATPATAAATATPTQNGVIEKTVQELLTELKKNPDLYKKGAVVRVSGVVMDNCRGDLYGYVYLDIKPTSNEFPGYVEFVEARFLYGHDSDCLQKKGTKITIEGKYDRYIDDKFVTDLGIATIIYLEDAVLIKR